MSTPMAPESAIDEVKRLYETEGYTFQRIADHYEVSISSVWRFFNRHGLTKRSMETTHRKVSLDTTFFERIDSHEKAQILGFIAADGCVTDYKERGLKLCGNYLQINFHQQDKDYLEEIRKRLRYGNDLKPRKPNQRSAPQYLLKIGSNKIVRDLKSLEVGPRKSLTLEFPSEAQVPRPFITSFVLGYFEGDGTIYHYNRKGRFGTNVSFVGSTPFISGLKAFVESLGVKCGKVVADGSVSKIAISEPDVHRFMTILYDQASFKMKRKHDRYLAMNKGGAS